MSYLGKLGIIKIRIEWGIGDGGQLPLPMCYKVKRGRYLNINFRHLPIGDLMGFF